MRFSQMISAIDTHTVGEAARVIIGGIHKFPGTTMAEKKKFLEEHRDDLRKIVMHEPRGHNDMFGAFICEPVHPEADYGIIFMDGGGYLTMCGHNTIAAMTIAVECGWLQVPQGAKEVKVVQDTPAGLIEGTVYLNDTASVEAVSFNNAPAFLYKENVSIAVPNFGTISCDISFGGNFFALLPATEIGLDIIPENRNKITEIALAIREAINKQVPIQHPTMPHINKVELVEIYGPPKSRDATLQNVVVFGNGQTDRSPCGTGTSAKLAALYGKGKMQVGESFVYESIIGTKFKGEIVKSLDLAGYKAIIPRITGSAYITGFNAFLVNPQDPLKTGFCL